MNYYKTFLDFFHSIYVSVFHVYFTMKNVVIYSSFQGSTVTNDSRGLYTHTHTHTHTTNQYFSTTKAIYARGLKGYVNAVIREHICETPYRVKKMTSY